MVGSTVNMDVHVFLVACELLVASFSAEDDDEDR
jgi:hypothetical protein